VRLAALRGEKAVTFHKQCGLGWLGLDRIYFLDLFRHGFLGINADRSKSTTEARRHRGKLNLQVLS
jgi:hypothetical protein